MKTQVTEAGVKKLAAKLPGCTIQWDGGTIPPDPNYLAAAYVLSVGGRVGVNGGRPEIRQPSELPREAFTLTTVWLESGMLPEAGAAAFKGCKNLTHLRVLVPVTDAWLANFADCKELTFLNLANGATEAGLAYFKNCEKLTIVNLSGLSVTDAALAHFKKCKLVALDLGSTGVTAAGLVPFQKSESLSIVSVYNTPVGKESVARFRGCPNLTWLNVSMAGADSDTIGELTRALPACGIIHDKGKILPRDKGAADRAAAYLVLLTGGRVRVNGGSKWFAGTSDLPQTFLLTGVDIAFTPYTNDPFLDFFKSCKELTELDVRATEITEPACREFEKAHPQCRIKHNGGTIEPKK